ncbi:MAG: hypothetical protein OXN89_03605 [Bryobacterales bacterium]|nr:hypothetical protein [Bryobacterales bacterium]
MSQMVGRRPVFMLAMGCDGASKSVWKRESWDLLADRDYGE